jgi:hypothetical protein
VHERRQVDHLHAGRQGHGELHVSAMCQPCDHDRFQLVVHERRQVDHLHACR